MNPTNFDPDAIANLRSLDPDGGDEFLREVIGIFREDTPRRLTELDRSLAAGDEATFIRAAHSIKGSAASIGATALRQVSEQLEQQAKNHGLAGTAAPLAILKSEFVRTCAALNDLLPPA